MRKHKWTIKEQADFLKKTGELLNRGYPLAEAIHSLTYQMKKSQKERIIQSLEYLKEGHPFYKILLEMNFNQTLIGFVYFAEQHGSVADAFEEGSKMMLKRGGDLQKLRKIVFYPIVLMIITIFLFIFVERILLPKYSSLFLSMDLSPNVFTKLVYIVGDILPLILYVFAFSLLFAIGFYFLQFRKLSPIKQKTLLVKLPIIGDFYRLLTTHYFTVQLSYLLGGGLSILESLKLFEQHINTTFDRQLGHEIQKKLTTGKELEDILKEYVFFERELPFIVKHGHENGKLHQELFIFSKHCMEKLEEKTERMLKTIQPILYSIIGIVIVSMYLAILLPMFRLLDGF